MKSFSVATLLLVVVLAISTAAAFPERTLLQQNTCADACNAVSRTDPDTLQRIANVLRREICACRCNEEPILHFAVRRNCGECIIILISSPSFCSLDTRDSSGNTAMHTMASLCQLGIDGRLIGLRFSVRSTNNAGDTPLCVASRVNNPNCGQVVRLLIEAGANAFRRCSDGRNSCRGCVNTNVCNVIGQDIRSTCP